MDRDASSLLEELGWDLFFLEHFELLNISGSIPARISAENRGAYEVYCRHGELTVKLSGKMRYLTGAGNSYPAVGDWVVIKLRVGEKSGIVHAVLPRKSKFSRKIAGEKTAEQVVAANVDTVFIVSGLDGGRNFNLRRIERYFTLAWNSGASPVVVLNKMDLHPDVDAYVRSVEAIASGIPIHPVSAKARIGLDGLMSYLTKGKTAAFLGSSGVGKSALINALLGIERQETGEVREDDHAGRHTTTRRELILLPGGGAVIDTPGMREIQMWAGEDNLPGVFGDIEVLAEKCRFNNCEHNSEPGCAVRDAIERGFLDPARLESYRKLQNEMDYLAFREQHNTRLREREKWKKIAQWSKKIHRPDQGNNTKRGS
jgi:ribosome biogenesis GTPase / thiamine phosphate phosphatase